MSIEKRLMSDAEIKRRKKLQSHISETTGALGLTALGGTLLATKRGNKLVTVGLKRLGKEPPRALSRAKVKDSTAPILATSAGIGGMGAFNFAAYTNAESRKRNLVKVPEKKPIKKSYETEAEMDFTFGEEGIAKAWSPTARQYDPEAKRTKRTDRYEQGTELAVIGAGATTAGYGLKALGRTGRSTMSDQAAAREKAKRVVNPKKVVDLEMKAESQFRGARRAGRRGAIAGGVMLGAMAAHHHVKRKQEGSWQPYAKNYGGDSASAFGVEHY